MRRQGIAIRSALACEDLRRDTDRKIMAIGILGPTIAYQISDETGATEEAEPLRLHFLLTVDVSAAGAHALELRLVSSDGREICPPVRYAMNLDHPASGLPQTVGPFSIPLNHDEDGFSLQSRHSGRWDTVGTWHLRPLPPRLERTESPGPDDLADFVAWLERTGGAEANYVLARLSSESGYNMTGHAWSAFFGIREFLRGARDLRESLAQISYSRQDFWDCIPGLKQRFAEFVRTQGSRFPGPGGGDWRRKLPVSLGGTMTTGGGGSGLVARVLILLARYGLEKGFERAEPPARGSAKTNEGS